jgi:uncharacterized repeat protein (TIGR02543 family)
MLSKLFRYSQFGITGKKIAAVLLIWVGLSISLVTWADGFPNTGVDGVLSLSKFKVTFTREFAFYLKEVKGAPFCEDFSTPEQCPSSAREYTSPLLYDPNTKIGRSDPHRDGDNTDELIGTDICKDGDTNFCNDYDISIDDNFQWKDSGYQTNGQPFDEGPTGVEEVHTLLISSRHTQLDDSNSASAIRAGDQAPCQARSLGEIESLNGNGFPAESFFHMYMDFDIDLNNDGIVDISLYNNTSEPLVFESTGLTSFPPKVVYSLAGDGNAPKLYLREKEGCQLDPVFSGHMGWLRIMTFSVNIGGNKLIVNKIGTGTGNVTGQYIDCDSDCTEKTKLYVSNTQVTLTAIADTGYTFTGWSACLGTGDCIVTMDQAKTVTATFELPTVSSVLPLTATLNELTTFTVKGNYLTADTAFDIEQCDGLTQLFGGSDTQRQFQCTPRSTGTKKGTVKNKSGGTVLRDFEVRVDINILPTLTVITPSNGRVLSSPSGINCGMSSTNCEKSFDQTVTLTAYPDTSNNYVFAGWYGVDNCVGIGKCTIEINNDQNDDQNVTAIFKKPNEYPLTIIKNGKGTGLVTGLGIQCGSDCAETFKTENMLVTLTATGSNFLGWSGACSGKSTCQVLMNDNTQPVTATFDIIDIIEPTRPVAILTATPNSRRGTAPWLVKFNANQSSDPDGSISEYVWSINGGQNINYEDFTIDFEVGIHTVTLKVKDDKGAWSKTERWSVKVEPQKARLINLSTRAITQGGVGDIVAGFVISGTEMQRVMLRGWGLEPNVDPKLTVQKFPSGEFVAKNNDWQTDGRVSEIPLPLQLENSLDAGLLLDLPAGAYTATLTSIGNNGLALIGIDEVESNDNTNLINLSSRASIQGGAGDVIAGFVVGGTGTMDVLVRGWGLAAGVDTKLIIERYPSGETVASNDNWQTAPRAREIPLHQVLPNATDAGVLLNLPGGAYTATLSSVGDLGLGLLGIDEVTVIEKVERQTKLVNISSRAPIQGGANDIIAGFIIAGSGTQKVLIRGWNLESGVNPTLTVQKSPSGELVATNDNWQADSRAPEIPAHLALSNPIDAGLLLDLPTGAYTATLSSIGTPGLGLIGVDEVEPSDTAKLINLSSRAPVQGGANDIIAGFVISGIGQQKVMIRGWGIEAGVDPILTLNLYPSGAFIASNNNWQTDSKATEIPEHLKLPKRTDAGLLLDLPVGTYTVTLGSVGAKGLGLVGVDIVE